MTTLEMLRDAAMTVCLEFELSGDDWTSEERRQYAACSALLTMLGGIGMTCPQ